MTDIKSWSTAAASNNSASPDGAPEGMAPSGVNDTIREVMAAVRRWFESAQWTDLGDIPTRTGATTFTLVGDKTATYTVNRRLKLADASTLYGIVTISSYGAPNTTITVALDSGALTGSLSAVAAGIVTPTNWSLPTIPVANGGTGASDAATARTNLGAMTNPLATRGDIIIENSTPAPARLAIGAEGSVLSSNGTDPSWSPVMPTSYLRGLNMSAPGANKTLTINAGASRSDDDATNMVQAANFTKAVGTAWAVGTANGSLDTGAIAATTWYHVYQIERTDTGVVDYLTSLSASAPTMPANYTKKRRIGSFKTDGSSNILAFSQQGNEFLLAASVLEFDTSNPGTTAVTVTLAGVPTGIIVRAIEQIGGIGTTAQFGMYVSALVQNDEAPQPPATAALAAPGLTVTCLNSPAVWFMARAEVQTNVSAQIRYRCSATGANDHAGAASLGWIDTRGRDT
jgi:hypothetical protein